MPRVRIRFRKPFLAYKPGDAIMWPEWRAKVAVELGIAAYEKAIDEPPADKMVRGAKTK